MITDKNITKALRQLEYGVYVVTMGHGTEGNAFTASWVSQISSEPPMIALSVHNKHQSSRLINNAGSFVVHLISSTHAEFAKIYYGPAESGYDKLKNADIANAPITGSPLLKGAAGYLECRIVNSVAAGNHTLYVAEVVAAGLDDDGPKLTTSNSKLHYLG